MAYDSDYLVDRRRLKRRLTFWRVVAVIAIVIAAGSEIIALLPIKENAWVQLVVKALKVVFPKKPG